MFRFLFRILVLLSLFALGLIVYQFYSWGTFPKVERTIQDATLLGSVKTALAIHRELSGRSIIVNVSHGNVVLTGEVSSEDEQATAVALVETIAGVESVENRLNVKPNVVRQETEKGPSLGQRIDDTTLQTKVLAALRLHKGLQEVDFSVTAKSGHVIIEGVAASMAVIEILRERVMSVNGVETLDLRMELRETGVLDTHAKHVQNTLQENRNLARYALRANATDDTIVLTGSVTNSAERELAGLIAEREAPETVVQNKIRLEK